LRQTQAAPDHDVTLLQQREAELAKQLRALKEQLKLQPFAFDASVSDHGCAALRIPCVGGVPAVQFETMPNCI
jgi:hypothetical protein